MTNPTLQFYQKQARTFAESTIHVDMSHLYSHFIKCLSSNSHIVDAGCGAGRYSKFFLNLGHQVTAFDASPALCNYASTYTGLDVINCTFDEFVMPAESIDGIWACASLLHVQKENLASSIVHLCKILKSKGVFYASFKQELALESQGDPREFTNLKLNELKSLFESCELDPVHVWETSDARPEKPHVWSNIIGRKRSS